MVVDNGLTFIAYGAEPGSESADWLQLLAACRAPEVDSTAIPVNSDRHHHDRSTRVRGALIVMSRRASSWLGAMLSFAGVVILGQKFTAVACVAIATSISARLSDSRMARPSDTGPDEPLS